MGFVNKWFLGKLGQLHAVPSHVQAAERVALPAPHTSGGMALMEALARRHSEREFAATPLSLAQLSDLLWAADGINRPAQGEHTAPSAMNAQEVDVYVALPEALYRYRADGHLLELVASVDARRVTGLQGFVDAAPLDLVYVADHRRMTLVPTELRASCAAVAVGAIAQNVALYCAANGLVSVVRALFDAKALASALSLAPEQHVVLAQTVGYSAAPH